MNPLSEIEHTFIHTNGLRLHVAQAGSKDGPLLILLHGFPDFWYGWQRQIPALVAAGYRLWIPDQRGYNLSDKPKGIWNYAIEHLVADIIGLLDAADQEKCLLVGHDWGAAVAWETALRHTGRVRRLAILNVPHPDVMRRFLLSDFSQMRKSWYIYFFQIPLLPEAMLRVDDWAPAIRMLQKSSGPDAFTDEDIEQYRQAWWRKDAMTSMINWYRAAFRGALRGPLDPGGVHLRPVSVPTLILWGVNDVALSVKMVKPSLELCRNGRLVLFEDVSHWPQRDKPESVNQHLLAFFG